MSRLQRCWSAGSNGIRQGAGGGLKRWRWPGRVARLGCSKEAVEQARKASPIPIHRLSWEAVPSVTESDQDSIEQPHPGPPLRGEGEGGDLMDGANNPGRPARFGSPPEVG